MNNSSGLLSEEKWDTVITPHPRLFSLNIGEILKFSDLLFLFVKRDIVTQYKQTILGPIWLVLQPLLTTLMYTVVFGNIAGVSTDGLPGILFYLASIPLWNYFSDTLTTTSKTFTENASVFGKVYFPRMILPLSKIFSGLIKYAIQFCLFAVIWAYHFAKGTIHPNVYIIAAPFILLVLAILSLGLGILITSMTTKYRDLTFLITFGVQLLMYATPVIYPLSTLKSPTQQFIMRLNPLTSLFELFKYGFLGKGDVNFIWLGYSLVISLLIVFVGLVVFNRVEKKFIDTV